MIFGYLQPADFIFLPLKKRFCKEIFKILPHLETSRKETFLRLRSSKHLNILSKLPLNYSLLLILNTNKPEDTKG